MSDIQIRTMAVQQAGYLEWQTDNCAIHHPLTLCLFKEFSFKMIHF